MDERSQGRAQMEAALILDPAVLGAAMARLSRLCYRVIWMNPHKGDNPDFRPGTVGMIAAAPYIDLMLSGHVHGGQIRFPVIGSLLVPSRYGRRYDCGTFEEGPTLLHVLTVKGNGVPQASEDPVTYHTPPVFEKVGPDRNILSLKRGGSKAYTDAMSSAIYQALQDDPKVAVMTAAMCQGNKLEKVRAEFPDRFFDVGICESHAVAFAAGLARSAGL